MKKFLNVFVFMYLVFEISFLQWLEKVWINTYGSQDSFPSRDDLVARRQKLHKVMKSFQKEKGTHIIINGETIEGFEAERIAYYDIAEFVYRKTLPNEKKFMMVNIPTLPQYTITFSRGPKESQKGILSKGESVLISRGMVFNCVLTNKA